MVHLRVVAVGGEVPQHPRDGSSVVGAEPPPPSEPKGGEQRPQAGQQAGGRGGLVHPEQL
eukprot:1195380-Prorocentrum_minimum.AAC.10